MESKNMRKIQRKLKHCEGILYKYENIKISKEPTDTLFIGNGGLGCGIEIQLLIDEFGSFGPLRDIIMRPQRPYAFVSFLREEDASKAYCCLNGERLKSGDTFYIGYVIYNCIPKRISESESWPPGLILLENFVNEFEESDLLQHFKFSNTEESIALKHRQVRHFGYEFIYGKNSIDKDKPLEQKIPDICLPHLEKLVYAGYIRKIPEQLTVNHYMPGQGIPPHIDTHSAFEDGIISFSLGSQIVMDFCHPDNRSTSILIPRKSVLIMTGESRYLWKHGITPRKSDILPANISEGNFLTLSHRAPRTSLTFRLIREEKCDCEYKSQCDSQSEGLETGEFVNENEAKELEKKYVEQVYENIADHFSDTRYKSWPKVSDFLKSVSPGSLILDVGCGNGKNMKLSNQCFEIGCDMSAGLAQVCASRGIPVIIANCLTLPFRNDCADVVICIAVIHHLSTMTRRSEAVQEILRVLKPGGKSLIYVWAFEQNGPEGPSNYLKWSKLKENPENSDNSLAFESSGVNQIHSIECSNRTVQMLIHKNRTNFAQQDLLVPWKEKKSSHEDSVYHRYYHVFVEGELETLITKNGGLILSSYYDKGNWCVLFEK